MIEVVERCDLKEFSVVVPSVCVGNVGQLAADLLICSLDLRRLGYVWHSQVLPFCGAEPFGRTSNVSTACELYFSEELKLIVFQIRSAFKRDIKSFLEDMCAWLKENEVKQVIILTGISAHRRGDRQLMGEPLRYVFCPITKAQEAENARSRNWVELESQSSQENFPSYVPGAGVAVKWFHKCVQSKIPCSILLEFCSDGNNIPDAIKLADYLNQWLHLRHRHHTDSWTFPSSWNLLFGSHPPAEIFN